MDITARWQVDSKSFDEILIHNVPSSGITHPQAVGAITDIVRKLSGALYLLGPYYWTFMEDFYRWAATECLEPEIRYSAAVAFHEVALSLPPKLHSQVLAPIFVAMYYEALYPRSDTLEGLLSNGEDGSVYGDQLTAYTPEHIAIIDSIIFVFAVVVAERV